MTNDLKLVHSFIDNHPKDAAQVLERLELDDLREFLNFQTVSVTAQLLSVLTAHRSCSVLARMKPARAATFIEELDLDVGARLLRRLTAEIRDEILANLAVKKRKALAHLLQYRNSQAGSLMDPLVFTLPEDISVAEARDRLLKHPDQAIFYIYVLSRSAKLTGVMNIRELMRADPEATVIQLARREVEVIRADADRNQVSSHPAWLKYHSLPVVDKDKVFLGAIRYRRLRQLESETKMERKQGAETGRALAELYRVGLASLWHTLAEDITPTQEPGRQQK